VAVDAVTNHNATVATSSTTPEVSTAATRANSLGSDAFLQLLIVQLQNQDPTNPQSNTEFIAQLATFSSLEQLTGINQKMTDLTQLLNDASEAVANEGMA